MSASSRSMSRRSGLGVACAALPWLWLFLPEEEEPMATESSRVDLCVWRVEGVCVCHVWE